MEKSFSGSIGLAHFGFCVETRGWTGQDFSLRSKYPSGNSFRMGIFYAVFGDGWSDGLAEFAAAFVDQFVEALFLEVLVAEHGLG